MSETIVLIYARAANGVIGSEGDLPWRLPADLKRFKALTMGTPMVMGRKTFESLPGLLPGRRHIVLTRNSDWQAEGAEVVTTPQDALSLARDHNDSGQISIVGGAAIYNAFMPYADTIELTQIHRDYAGDTVMGDLGDEWTIVAKEDHAAKDDHPAYSFITFRRAEARA